jgi:predicted DsbA family dithiol-disulfide isomerase
VARAAHAFALANPNITAEVVECQEFPEVANRYHVTGVPKTVINDRTEFVGAVPDEMFVNAILEALGKPPVDWENAPGLPDADGEAPTSSL